MQLSLFQPEDRSTIVAFVEGLQEVELRLCPDMALPSEIAGAHAAFLLRHAAERDGVVLLAKAGPETVGFVSAWVEHDEDLTLREEARAYCFISDVFVVAPWRRKGVATRLLAAVEEAMRKRGCRRFRIHAKAGNEAAARCYEAAGYGAYEVIFVKRPG